MTSDATWVLIGLLGQLMFTGRFLVQWLSSEKAGRSVVPLSFWFLSLAGGGTLLSYAVYRADPVFILGQSLGVGIYLRNLQLIYRERTTDREQASADGRLACSAEDKMRQADISGQTESVATGSNTDTASPSTVANVDNPADTAASQSCAA